MPTCQLIASSVLQLTNSNTAIGILNRCGITTSYTTERRLEKEAVIALVHVAETDEVYKPPEICGSTQYAFSVDNWDWAGRSCYEAGSTHITTVYSGMGMVVKMTPISLLQSLLVLRRKTWRHRYIWNVYAKKTATSYPTRNIEQILMNIRMSNTVQFQSIIVKLQLPRINLQRSDFGTEFQISQLFTLQQLTKIHKRCRPKFATLRCFPTKSQMIVYVCILWTPR